MADMLKSKKGFTLLEVLIALMILSITLVTLSSGEAVVLHATRRSKLLTLASIAARNLMTQIDVMVDSQGFNYLNKLPEKEEKEFEEELYKGWKWKREIKEVKFPVSAMINAVMEQSKKNDNSTETDPVGEQMLDFIIQNFEQVLNDAAKEITITVFWPVKAGLDFMNFKVVYYVIDYKVVQEYVPTM